MSPELSRETSGELSRPLVAAEVPPGGMERGVEAAAAECAAVAERLAIPAVAALRCVFRLRPLGPVIRAQGRLRAEVTRICVVSLDPFQESIDEDFAIRFVPAGTEADEDPESEDEIPMTDGAFDLGEAAVEQLALALDPYPRKPGAVLPDSDPDPADNPFAALVRMRRPD